MKKVLFASTALVMSAGFAAADIAISGSAGAGLWSDGSDNQGVYSFAGVDFTMTGETDNGLTFGATVNIDAGNEYDTGDFELDGVDANAVSLGSVYVSGGFGTITFDSNGIDDLYNDDNAHDMSYSYSANGLSFDLTLEVDGASASAVSAKVAYTMDAFTGSLTASDVNGGSYEVDLAYAVSDDLTVGLNHDMPNGADAVTEARVAFAADGFSASVSMDTADNWDLSLGYTFDATTISASTDEASAWELTMSSDLGGGASLVAGINADSAVYAGLAMTF